MTGLYIFKPNLLCISYKFVTRFLVIPFYYFLFQTETYMVYVNVFHVLKDGISVGSDLRQNFSIDPHCNIRLLLATCCQKWTILQWVSMGKILTFAGSKWNLVSRLKKPVDAYHVNFRAELATMNKKVIANKRVTYWCEIQSGSVDTTYSDVC